MIEHLRKINDYLWEIPDKVRQDMRVPARVFSSLEMFQHISRDKSLEQLINVATLPGICNFAIVMPDAHEGYGFPIGAVAAIDIADGIISPGGIGYDINCGVRLLRTNFEKSQLKDNIDVIAKELYRSVPSGVGKGGKFKLNIKEMDKVLNNGVLWAIDNGYGLEADLDVIESKGSLQQANAEMVSNEAKLRGMDQLGTMGAGNHFVEIDFIHTIYDDEAANAFEIFQNQVVIQIHTGSRGLGHQVATDYIKKMLNNIHNFSITIPDRELSCAPFKSELGQNYFEAMCAAANFAWTNRQLITQEIRDAWFNIFGNAGGKISILYDVAHNIAKLEEYEINGVRKNLIVHRKGATRAFPANNNEVPYQYRHIGQPVLIPGSMGTSSYILSGMPDSINLSFGSSCHGAGRMLSRTKARKNIQGQQLMKQLIKQGIAVQTGSMKGLSEEAPFAYKDVESVVDIVEKVGIAKKVARLKPMAVVKG